MVAHVKNNSVNNEWYTPKYIVDAAREVLGDIDLDPASSPTANKIVQAKYIYTAEDSGLNHRWYKNIWMNPPYQRGLVNKFLSRLVEDYKAGRVCQACVLVNNATETIWWQHLSSVASAVCFLRGRVKFLDEHGNKANSPLQGQCVVYIGENKDSFHSVFSSLGVCVNVLSTEELQCL